MRVDTSKQTWNARFLSMSLASIAFVQMSHGGITPALAVIGSTFSAGTQTNMAMLNTLPVLLSIPASYIAGRYAGQRKSYKTWILVGLLLVLIGGLTGFFCTDLTGLFICRGVVGVGLGTVVTLVSSLTLRCYEGSAAAKQLALNSMSANVGSILFQLIGGYMCLIGWKYTFLCYLIVSMPLAAVVLCLPQQAGMVSVQEKKQENKPPIKTICFWCCIYFLFFIAFYVFVNNMSWVIVGNGYGTSADVAWVLSVFNIGGLCGGALYRKHLFKLGPYVFLTALLLCGMGFGCVILAKELWVLYGAAILFGGGFGIFVPAAMYYGGTSVEAAQRSTMVSYMSIANNLGGFSSAYLLSAACALLGLEGRIMHFYLGIGVFSIVAGILLVWGLKEKDKRTDT